MSAIITAEHFELSDESKATIEGKLEKLFRLLPETAQLRLSIKQEARGYKGTLTVHAGHEDIVYSDTASDLYALVSSVKAHAMKELVVRKDKRLARRKGMAS